MPRNYALRISESSETGLTYPGGDGPVTDVETTTKRSNNPGCYVSYVNAFIALLAAIVLAICVGLIVGLAHPALKRDPDPPACPTTASPLPTTDSPPTTADPEIEWLRCVNMSWERGDCLPGLVCTTLKPTVTSTTLRQTTSTPVMTSPTTTSSPPVDMRLPDSLKPTHYDLLLRPDLYSQSHKDFHFNGSVQITIKAMKQTTEIRLHTKDLDINQNSVRVESTDGGEMVISSIHEEKLKEFLMIELRSHLQQGSVYKLYIEFTASLTDDLQGLYLSSYTDGDETRYIATSHLQPTYAREVFPCFDEPAMKATFNVSIDRKRPFKAMSNAELLTTEQLSDGWLRDRFASTPPMSTYLLAFVISDFKCVQSNTTDHKKVEICARPNVIEQTEFSAEIAGQMQQYYEQYHNIELPIPKMGHVGVPDFNSGAMENWGLIIYRETALFYDPDTSTAQARQRVAVVIAHELAHMWFGDLVTPTWWSDIWLNEGFASYLEWRGVNHVFPDWGMEYNTIKDDLLPSMALDSLITSHPIYQPADTPAQINELFDTITYCKGASVIRMMEFFLGNETFRLGLSNYLNYWKFKAAHHADLFAYLSEQAKNDGKDINVTSVMSTWVLEPGYPVVNVKYDATSGRVGFSQTRFLLNPPSHYNQRSLWKIPISMVTDKHANWDNPTITWLTQKTDSWTDIELKGGKWILANIKFKSFYRTNYDESNWDALTTQLIQDHTKIDVANRVQLIDDSFNLGRAGYTSQLLAMNITKYLGREKDYLPWVAAQRGFLYLVDMLDMTTNYGMLRSYIQSLVRNMYNELGWADSVEQPHLMRQLRSVILHMACDYGISTCHHIANDKFKTWMKNNTRIESGFQPLVFCEGIKMGMQAEWDFMFDKFHKSQSGAERKTFLQALACTRELWILKRYLTLALEENLIRRQDFETVVEAVAGNPLGRAMTWDFFVSNWDIIFKRFGGSSFTLSDIVESVTATFSTEEQLEALKAFMKDHPDQGTATNTFKNVVESTEANIKWRKANEELVFDWLRGQ